MNCTIRNLALFFVIICQFCFTIPVYAQTIISSGQKISIGPTKGSIFASTSDPSNQGIDVNSVNLYTGQHIESFPIIALEGTGGLGASVILDYNGNVARTAKAENHKSQTSPFGLGFSLGTYSIVCDHRNTVYIDDDRYTLIDCNESIGLLPVGDDEYILADGKPWIITRTVESISSYETVVGWTIKKEDGTIYKYGDFGTTLSNLNATRNILRYGNSVGSGVTNDDAVFPFQWDLKIIHDPDSINWLEFTYLQDIAYLAVMDGNDDSTGSANPYTRSSYISEILTSDGMKAEFHFSARSDTGHYYGYNNYEYFSTKKVDSVRVISSDETVLSCNRFHYNYLSENSLEKLTLSEIEPRSGDGTQSLPSTYFYYDEDTLNISYGAITNIQYPSGSVKEITYKKLASTDNFSTLDALIYDSSEYRSAFDSNMVVGDGIFVSRLPNAKFGIWDGYWHIDSISLNNGGNDIAAVSPDGWVAMYDYTKKQIIVERWMGGYWVTDSVQADSLYHYDDVYLYAGKDYIVAVTGTLDGHCDGEGTTTRGLKRVYYYRWDGEKWKGYCIIDYAGFWPQHNVILHGDMVYIPVADYEANCADDMTTVYWGMYDYVDDTLIINSITPWTANWSVFHGCSFGPSFFGVLGYNGLNFYRYNGSGFDRTVVHDTPGYYARSIAPLPNGLVWSYDDGGNYNESVLSAAFLTSTGLRHSSIQWLNQGIRIDRLRATNHSIAAQFSTGNMAMFEWLGNSIQSEHNIWSSTPGSLPMDCTFDVWPTYYFIGSAQRIRNFLGDGDWEDNFTTIVGDVSTSAAGILAHRIPINKIQCLSSFVDSIFVGLFDSYYSKYIDGWGSDYYDIGLKYVDDCSPTCDECWSDGDIRAENNSMYYLGTIYGYDISGIYPCYTDHLGTWYNSYAFKRADTLFTGKPQMIVVDSISMYEYADHDNATNQKYEFLGGFLDKSTTTPRFTRAKVSTPYFDDDDPEGWTVTYFYNDLSDTTIADGHIATNVTLPDLQWEITAQDDTILTYGIENGGYWLDGMPYLTYSYTQGSGTSENVDYTYYYYKLYQTRDAATYPLMYHKLLDSTVSRENEMVSKTSYFYETDNVQVKETQVLRDIGNDNDSLVSKVVFAYENNQDMENDNAITQVESELTYYLHDGDPDTREILSYSGQFYDKHGNWIPVRAFKIDDYSDTATNKIYPLDTMLFTSKGNSFASVNIVKDTSWVKYDATGWELIASATGCSYTDFLIQDFEQGVGAIGWDGWNVDTGSTSSYGIVDSSIVFTGNYSRKLFDDPAKSPNWGPKRTIPADSLSDSLFYFSCWVRSNYEVTVGCYCKNDAGASIGDSIKEFTDLDPNNWQKIEGVFDLSGINWATFEDLMVQISLDEDGTGTDEYAYIDNFRFHPLEAQVTTTVYDKSTGLVTAQLDANNIPSKTEYDKFHRPVKTKNYKDETLSKTDYFFHAELNRNAQLVSAGSGVLDTLVVVIDEPFDSVYFKSRFFFDADPDSLIMTKIYNKRTSESWQRIFDEDDDDVDIIYIDTGYIETQLGDSIIIVAHNTTTVGVNCKMYCYDSDELASSTDSTKPHAIKSTSYDENGDSTFSVSFYNNLGRVLQTRSLNYAVESGDTLERAVVSGYSEYDARGRTLKSYKPYHDLVGFSRVKNFTPPDEIYDEDTTYYKTLFPSEYDRPYGESDYDSDIKGRLIESSLPGAIATWGLGNGHTSEYEYVFNTQDDAIVNRVFDQDGDSTVSLADRWGRFTIDTAYYTRKDAQGVDEIAYIATSTFNNVNGKVDSVCISESDTLQTKIRQYWYNDLGQLTQEWRIDYGDIRMMYDQKGKLRFMTNDKRYSECTSVYFKYDRLGRKIEEGLFDVGRDTSVSIVNPDVGYDTAKYVLDSDHYVEYELDITYIGSDDTCDVRVGWYDMSTNQFTIIDSIICVDTCDISSIGEFWAEDGDTVIVIAYKMTEVGQATWDLSSKVLIRDAMCNKTNADIADFPSSPSDYTPYYRWTYDYDPGVDNSVNYGSLKRTENTDSSYYKEYYYFPFDYKDSVVTQLLINNGDKKSVVHYRDGISGRAKQLAVFPFEDSTDVRITDYIYDQSGKLKSLRENGTAQGVTRNYATYAYSAAEGIDSVYLGEYDTTESSFYSQHIDYTYDIRGRLTGINDPDDVVLSLSGYGANNPHFGMSIEYTDGGNGYYNGRIKETLSRNSIASDTLSKWNRYTFNELSWLTKWEDWNGIVALDERDFWYNYIGNRDSTEFGITKTKYRYSSANGSSRLLGFGNPSDTLLRKYDILGNLVVEEDSDTIYYDYRNQMNLTNIDQTYSGARWNSVECEYDQMSRRIRQANSYHWRVRRIEEPPPGEPLVGDSTLFGDSLGFGGGQKVIGPGYDYYEDTTEYHYLYDGGVMVAVFDEDDDVNQLYINGPSGTVAVYGQNLDSKRHYFLKDQIGNTRVMVNDTGLVVVYNNFYPFGSIQSAWNTYNEPTKFTGKIRDGFRGFNYDYFGARYYDYELGMYSSMDKASQFASGFNYCNNNPIMAVDPDGNWAFLVVMAKIYFEAQALKSTYDLAQSAVKGELNFRNVMAYAGSMAASSIVPGAGSKSGAFKHILSGAGKAGVGSIVSNGINQKGFDQGRWSTGLGKSMAIGAARGYVNYKHPKPILRNVAANSLGRIGLNPYQYLDQFDVNRLGMNKIKSCFRGMWEKIFGPDRKGTPASFSLGLEAYKVLGGGGYLQYCDGTWYIVLRFGGGYGGKAQFGRYTNFKRTLSGGISGGEPRLISYYGTVGKGWRGGEVTYAPSNKEWSLGYTPPGVGVVAAAGVQVTIPLTTETALYIINYLNDRSDSHLQPYRQELRE